MNSYDKTDIEVVKKDLKELDERRFEKRAERLKILRENSVSIRRDLPNRASSYRDEASECFINGNFRACIFACAVSADQILRHEIIKLSKDKIKTLNKIEGNSFGFCIKFFHDELKKDSFENQLNQLITKFETINNIRNILSVHPAYTDFPIKEEKDKKFIDMLISKDVYRAYELLYSLLYPKHLAHDRMTAFLKGYKINYTNLTKGAESHAEESMYDILKNNFNVNGSYFPSDWFGSQSVDQELLPTLALETYKILRGIIIELYGEKDERDKN